MALATFFISTGRCGTQWIYHNLKSLLGSNCVIRHELLVDDYKSRYFFECFHKKEIPQTTDKLENHVKHIQSLLEKDKSYIEVGWPCYGLIPFFIDRLGIENIRIVHLYRNPIDCCVSLDSHKYYMNRERMEKRLLYPNTYGNSHQDFSSHWDSLDHVFKCLFFWTEINNFGLEIKNYFPSLDVVDLKFETLFKEGNHERYLLEKLADLKQYVNNIPVLEESKRQDNYQRPKNIKSRETLMNASFPEKTQLVMKLLNYSNSG